MFFKSKILRQIRYDLAREEMSFFQRAAISFCFVATIIAWMTISGLAIILK